MNDKFLMENLLYTSKVLNDLYMHGVIESSNEKMMILFNKVIGEMHNDIYKSMQEAGFYSISNVDKNKIEQMKQKLENSCNKCDCEE